MDEPTPRGALTEKHTATAAPDATEANGDVNESDPMEDHGDIVRVTITTIGLPMMFFRVHVVVT